MSAPNRQAALEWFSRRELGEGVALFCEPAVHDIFRANMFFVEGGERDRVMDFGMGLASPRAPLGPRKKPVLAVATHAHADHVGSLHEFAHRAGPRLEADAFASMPDEKTYADAFRALETPVWRPPHDGWNARDWRLAPAPLTLLLGEGDRIDLGDRSFRVLHLPGHSPGSIGLWDEGNGVLFSGDAVYEGELYDKLPDSDRKTYRRTMARLRELPARIVHAGHGESFGGARLRAIAQAYLERTA